MQGVLQRFGVPHEPPPGRGRTQLVSEHSRRIQEDQGDDRFRGQRNSGFAGQVPLVPVGGDNGIGTTYSSAAEKQAEDIVNIGQKYVQAVDDKGAESWAKFQMCKGLGNFGECE